MRSGKLVPVLLVLAITMRSRPASALVDLSGYWDPLFTEDQEERIPGPAVGDYLGLPLTDAARLAGDTGDASLLPLPEHQCTQGRSTYGFRGVGLLRIWAETDPATQAIVSIDTHIQWQEQRRRIYMDGRPHPPEYAART